MTKFAFAALILTVSSVTARAAVLLDTFAGVAPGYNASAGWAVQSAQWIARPFLVTSSHSLDSIVLPLNWNSGSLVQVTVSIQADAAGSPSGIPLESFIISNPGGADGAYLLTLTSATNPILTSGNYYVVATNTTSTTNTQGWLQSNDGHSSSLSGSFDGGATWASFNIADVAVTVNGTPVPEPSTALILAGGLVLGAMRRRRAQI
jgi:hypothetical protein